MVLGSEHSTVRAHAFIELDGVDGFALGEVDDANDVAISARLADPGVAVDRNDRKLAVRSGGHFMAGDTFLINGGDLFAKRGIDNSKRMVAFIGDEKEAFSV